MKKLGRDVVESGGCVVPSALPAGDRSPRPKLSAAGFVARHNVALPIVAHKFDSYFRAGNKYEYNTKISKKDK